MHRPPERATSSTRLLIGALSLLMLVTAYGAGYWLALDQNSIAVSAYVPTTFEPIYHSPGGLISEHFIASCFAPAHWVDRKIRPAHWNES